MADIDLKGIASAGYDVTISPADGSAGKIDGDEWARIGVGASVLTAAMCLIFLPIDGVSRELVVGAGIPMITTAATIATGSKPKKK